MICLENLIDLSKTISYWHCFAYNIEFDSNIILLKAPNTWVIGHGKINLVPIWNLHIYWAGIHNTRNFYAHFLVKKVINSFIQLCILRTTIITKLARYTHRCYSDIVMWILREYSTISWLGSTPAPQDGTYNWYHYLGKNP